MSDVGRSEAYEIGYRDGENNRGADFAWMFSEECGWPDEIDGSDVREVRDYVLRLQNDLQFAIRRRAFWEAATRRLVKELDLENRLNDDDSITPRASGDVARS